MECSVGEVKVLIYKVKYKIYTSYLYDISASIYHNIIIIQLLYSGNLQIKITIAIVNINILISLWQVNHKDGFLHRHFRRSIN